MDWRMQKRTVIMQWYHPISYKGGNRYIRYKNQTPCLPLRILIGTFCGGGSFCIKYKMFEK